MAYAQPVLSRFGLALVIAFFASITVQAGDVIEIEEHWALSVGGPDLDRSSPQVSMVMSATGDTDCEFFMVLLNHWTHPEYAPGGVQVQRWNGDSCLEAVNAATHQPLSHDGETIRWVQKLTLSEGQLTFEVTDGQSLTWGSFAEEGSLRITTNSSLARLNTYAPAVSLGDSGIGFAGNRVSSLVLERVRWRFEGEEEFNEMVAPIDIDADIDP